MQETDGGVKNMEESVNDVCGSVGRNFRILQEMDIQLVTDVIRIHSKGPLRTARSRLLYAVRVL